MRAAWTLFAALALAAVLGPAVVGCAAKAELPVPECTSAEAIMLVDGRGRPYVAFDADNLVVFQASIAAQRAR